MTPTISVIIPYYNGRDYLEEAIRSIINQVEQDFEILVLDDGSPQPADDIVRSFDDPRILYFQDENVGLPDNINRGLPRARGEYIARLDQDDVSEPERLSLQLAVFQERPSIDCVFTDIVRFGTAREFSRSVVELGDNPRIDFFDPWVHGCQVNSTMMVRKSVLSELTGYRRGYYPADDWDLELRMFDRQYQMVILRSPLVKYRFHSNANTYRTFSEMQDRRRLAEENYLRRAQALPELQLEEFLHEKRGTIITIARHHLKDKSKLYFRRFGGDFLDGMYIRAFLNCCIAFAYYPPTFISRLKYMIFKERSD